MLKMTDEIRIKHDPRVCGGVAPSSPQINIDTVKPCVTVGSHLDNVFQPL